MKRTSLLFLLSLSAAGLNSCNLVGALVNTALPFAGIKVAFACIPEQTRIDTPSGPRCIEDLEAGDQVTGFSGQPVRILQKHCYLENPHTVFLKVRFSGGATVDLCEKHRIAGIRAGAIRPGQRLAGHSVDTIESRTGETHSYDLLTEDAGYRIHGIPVNSMIEEMHAAAAGMQAIRKD